VDLVVVEVLQREASVLEQRRDRVGRCHQQAFLAVGEVHGPALAGAQPGEHRQVAPRRPFFRGEQQRSGAVGDRRAVARGERAAAARVEHRPQRPSFSSELSPRTLLPTPVRAV
jgi:hypothetical protein